MTFRYKVHGPISPIPDLRSIGPIIIIIIIIIKGKAVPVTGRGGPPCVVRRQGSQIFLDSRLTDCGEVSVTSRPLFTPQEDSLYLYLLEDESTPGPFFFDLRIVWGGVQTGSTRHRGHLLSYFTCPGRL
jgi:hypothetical protein